MITCNYFLGLGLKFHLPKLCPYSLGLSLLIYKMGMIISPLQDVYRDMRQCFWRVWHRDWCKKSSYFIMMSHAKSLNFPLGEPFIYFLHLCYGLAVFLINLYEFFIYFLDFIVFCHINFKYFSFVIFMTEALQFCMVTFVAFPWDVFTFLS